MSTQKEFRGRVPSDLNKLIRSVAAIKEQNLSDVLTEALQKWLEMPENKQLVKKHNLDGVAKG